MYHPNSPLETKSHKPTTKDFSIITQRSSADFQTMLKKENEKLLIMILVICIQFDVFGSIINLFLELAFCLLC